MKTVLITGASGFLGYNLLNTPIEGWNFVALTHQRNFSFRNITYLQANLATTDKIHSLLAALKPDAIIHLAAISDTNYCEQNTDAAFDVNVKATQELATYSAWANIPFIFTSTDLVFDGTKGNYHELDKPNPLNEYGKQKALAEQLVLQTHQQACVLRMPLIFGYGGYYAKSFLQPFIENLQAGKPLQLFTDEYRSVLDGESATAGIFMALANKWKGLYHLGGPQRLSRYEMMQQVCEIFSFDKNLLIPKLQKEISFAAKRPANVSFNSEKAMAAGFKPSSLEDALLHLKNEIRL